MQRRGNTVPSTMTATERGRSIVKHLVVGVLAPAVVAFGALVVVAAPASAAPVAPATSSALVAESFTGSTATDSSWRALGDGCLTRATVAPAATASSLGVCAVRVGSPPVSASTGYLQLTDASGYRKGGAVYTKASPSANGLDVTFDQWQYGSANYGGDGLSFFIADGAASITATGGVGSSLGYAQNTNQPTAPNGIAGAYLGVGLDSHGAFASSSDGHGTGCATGQSTTFQANSVVLRGPGSGKIGYCYLAATSLPTASPKLHVTLNDPAIITPAMARKFRVTVSPDRFPTVTVYAAFPANADLKQVLQYTMTDAAPATYQFGFTAASGSVVDTHLIGEVSASTVTAIDTTPPVVTITGGPTALVATTTPKLSGTTDNPAGSNMTVLVGSQKLSATVAADGTWNVTPAALAQGPVSVSVSATDVAGNSGTATQQLTIAIPAPTVPQTPTVTPTTTPPAGTPAITITGGATVLSNQAKPTISGTSTGVAGRTATISVGGQTLTSTVSPTGDWSVVPTALTQGNQRVVVKVSTSSGLTAASSQTLTVDTIAPAIVIDGGSTVSIRTTTLTISGRINVPAGSKIQVAVDKISHEVVVSSTRTWSLVATELTAGTHIVVVSATDAAGNVGTMQQRLTVVPALSIDGGPARLTNDATPTISGTTDAPVGTAVTVTIAGQMLTGTVAAPGIWSVDSRTLPSTVYPVLASVRDSAGTVRTARQSLTVDTIAPSIVIDGGSVVSTKSATPTISGRVNVPAGSKIQVVVDKIALEVVVSSTRTWTVTSPQLTAGAHTVGVSATDAAGNVGTQLQRLTVIK